MQIVRYKLKFIDGVGHQPYHDIARFLCSFEGGSYGAADDYMIGYISGEPDDIVKAITACSEDYGMTAVSNQEALIIADLCNTPGKQNEYGQYLQPATIVDGKISQVYTSVPPENPEINLLLHYKEIALNNMYLSQSAIQNAGYTCTNNIKLQVREEDLNRWTQLMVGLSVFQPAQVYIRDYDNVIHAVSLVDATQMLGEVFVWGQTFLGQTWAMKDNILSKTTIAQLEAL